MPEAFVRLPSRLSIATLPRVCADWPVDAPTVNICFDEHAFVLPSGIVGVSCLVEAARERDQRVMFRTGRCQSVSYWERMGFFELFGERGTPGMGVRRPADGRFVELKRICFLEEVDEITAGLLEVVNPQGEDRRIYNHVVSEALNNVCQHSGATGFCSAQFYRNEGVVRFAIADLGRGLKSALQRFNPQDDAEAITSQAEQLAVPKEARNRGVGLTAIDRLAAGTGGDFLIWSGACRYDATSRSAGWPTAPWRGTMLAVRLPRHTFDKRFVDIMAQVRDELRQVEPKQDRPMRRLP